MGSEIREDNGFIGRTRCCFKKSKNNQNREELFTIKKIDNLSFRSQENVWKMKVEEISRKVNKKKNKINREIVMSEV